MKIVVAESDVLSLEGLCILLAEKGHDIVGAVSEHGKLYDSVATLLRGGQKIDLVISEASTVADTAGVGIRSAISIRTSYPRVPILVLSELLSDCEAIRDLMSIGRPDCGGVGHIVRSRLGGIEEFLRVAQVVVSGGTVVDQSGAELFAEQTRNKPELALTLREQQIIELLASGFTNEQIAGTLYVSHTAVVKHIGSIFSKLDLRPADGNRRVLTVLRFLEMGQRLKAGAR